MLPSQISQVNQQICHTCQKMCQAHEFSESWGLNESRCAPTPLSAVYSLCRAVWVMKVTEKTPALNRYGQRGREKDLELDWQTQCLIGETHNKATSLHKLSHTATGQEGLQGGPRAQLDLPRMDGLLYQDQINTGSRVNCFWNNVFLRS